MKANIPIKEFSYLDFESNSNALIDFLNNYGKFSKLSMKTIDYQSKPNEIYILIEKEYFNSKIIKNYFTNIEIIENQNILLGCFKLIIS